MKRIRKITIDQRGINSGKLRPLTASEAKRWEDISEAHACGAIVKIDETCISGCLLENLPGARALVPFSALMMLADLHSNDNMDAAFCLGVMPNLIAYGRPLIEEDVIKWSGEKWYIPNQKALQDLQDMHESIGIEANLAYEDNLNVIKRVMRKNSITENPPITGMSDDDVARLMAEGNHIFSGVPDSMLNSLRESAGKVCKPFHIAVPVGDAKDKCSCGACGGAASALTPSGLLDMLVGRAKAYRKTASPDKDNFDDFVKTLEADGLGPETIQGTLGSAKAREFINAAANDMRQLIESLNGSERPSEVLAKLEALLASKSKAKAAVAEAEQEAPAKVTTAEATINIKHSLTGLMEGDTSGPPQELLDMQAALAAKGIQGTIRRISKEEAINTVGQEAFDKLSEGNLAVLENLSVKVKGSVTSEDESEEDEPGIDEERRDEIFAELIELLKELNTMRIPAVVAMIDRQAETGKHFANFSGDNYQDQEKYVSDCINLAVKPLKCMLRDTTGDAADVYFTAACAVGEYLLED